MINQLPEMLLALLTPLICTSLFQGTLNRLGQPLQPLLEQVVDRACFHALHRFLGINRPGDNDDRDFGSPLPGQLQRGKAVEAWQAEGT